MKAEGSAERHQHSSAPPLPAALRVHRAALLHHPPQQQHHARRHVAAASSAVAPRRRQRASDIALRRRACASTRLCALPARTPWTQAAPKSVLRAGGRVAATAPAPSSAGRSSASSLVHWLPVISTSLIYARSARGNSGGL